MPKCGQYKCYVLQHICGLHLHVLLLVHHPATEKSEVEAKLKEAMLLILHFKKNL